MARKSAAQKAQEEVVVEQVVEVETDSNSEHEEVEVPKVKKAKAVRKPKVTPPASDEEVEEKPVKAKKAKASKKEVVVPVTDESEHSDVETSGSEETKTRKTRKPLNLQTILDTLKDEKTSKAIKMLEQYVEKYGVGGKKKRVGADGEKKPMSAYNKFIKDEMAKMTDIAPKDRMKEANAAWKAFKAANA